MYRTAAHQTNPSTSSLTRRSFVGAGGVAALALLGAAVGETGEDAASSASSDESGLGLVEAGKLIVGSDCDYPPFIWMDGEQPQGFECEMLLAMCEKMGLELEYLAPQNFDTLVASIVAGGIMDIAVSSITINDDRLEEVDFCEPYFDSNLSLSVMADSGYTSADDLAGLKVGVQSGTTGASWAQENLSSSEIVSFNDQSAAFVALQSGRVDAVCIDLPVAQYMINTSYTDCAILEEIATGEQYGIAVSKDNPALLDAVNEALQEIIDDGTYDELYESYFGA